VGHVLRLIDREQAKRVAGFRSTSRANARLLGLTKTGLLVRTAVGTSGPGQAFVYALTRDGARTIDVPWRPPLWRRGTRIFSPFVAHQRALNEFYLAVKYPRIVEAGVHVTRWDADVRPTVTLIPDSYFEVQTPVGLRGYFVEMDRGTEPQRIWRTKVDAYLRLALSGDFARQFAPTQFGVLVLADTDRRLTSIRATVVRITDKLFWFTTTTAVAMQGPWAPIWTRARAHAPRALISPL
jgi:hypothetical protein